MASLFYRATDCNVMTWSRDDSKFRQRMTLTIDADGTDYAPLGGAQPGARRHGCHATARSPATN
jgi:hypothetical protein